MSTTKTIEQSLYQVEQQQQYDIDEHDQIQTLQWRATPTWRAKPHATLDRDDFERYIVVTRYAPTKQTNKQQQQQQQQQTQTWQ
jgi:hypothetical protein